MMYVKRKLVIRIGVARLGIGVVSEDWERERPRVVRRGLSREC